MQSWNVLRCLPRFEIYISRKLEGFGLESLCPLYRVKSTRFGRPFEDDMPILSSYVFFRGDFSVHHWHRVRGINGVLQILDGNVAHTEIETFRSWVGVDGDYWKIDRDIHSVMIDQTVMVTEGIFQGHFGVVLSISEKTCEVQLNSSLLGHQIVVIQPIFWCEPFSETAAIRARSERKRGFRGGKRHNRLRRHGRNTMKSDQDIIVMS
jgi:hypothetical protein